MNPEETPPDLGLWIVFGLLTWGLLIGLVLFLKEVLSK